MSLVNQVLRDLDARRAIDGARSGLPEAVTPLARRQEHGPASPWRWIGLLAAIAVAASLVWAWTSGRFNRPAPPLVAIAPLAAPPTTVVPPLPLITPAAPAAPIAPPTSTPDPIPLAPPVVEKELPPPTSLTFFRLDTRLSKTSANKSAEPGLFKADDAKLADSAPPPAATSATAIDIAPRVDKHMRQLRAEERAETEFQRGQTAQRQGQSAEALAFYRNALQLQNDHANARAALAALLIEAKQFAEAEELLRQGIELAASRRMSVLMLARLLVERNQLVAALELLQKHADLGQQSPEYHGFTATLLNRSGRAREAAEHYAAATRLAPNEARWWAGLGMALEAEGKPPAAREAFQKAHSLPGLPADLAQHVEQRLK
ncbi:MAG TPA: tetratricopeptide repeat protein [Rhodocyclaceae bacterium]|nr:tetratricopeptide repeat protein [Rhodocyclaceae bacterium]